jgi:hypothetical protein
MPTVETVVCTECDFVQQLMWSEYGAISPCLFCDAAPTSLEKLDS